MTPQERVIRDALLSADFEGAEQIHAAEDSLRVAGVCGCGCPSIYFRASEGGGGIRLAAEGVTATGERSVLLFVDASGQPDSLELFWQTETIPADFPGPHELAVTAR